MQAMKEEYSQWKRANEDIIKGRNRLYELYHLVSTLYIYAPDFILVFQFGPAVLLDRRLSVENLGKRTTKEYAAVLEIISNKILAEAAAFEEGLHQGGDYLPHYADIMMQNAKQLVLRFASVLGNARIAEFLEQFFQKFPSTLPAV